MTPRFYYSTVFGISAGKQNKTDIPRTFQLTQAFTWLLYFCSLDLSIGLDIQRGEVHFDQITGVSLSVIPLWEVTLAQDLPWNQHIINELDFKCEDVFFVFFLLWNLEPVVKLGGSLLPLRTGHELMSLLSRRGKWVKLLRMRHWCAGGFSRKSRWHSPWV